MKTNFALATTMLTLICAGCAENAAPVETDEGVFVADPGARSGKADSVFDDDHETIWATIAARCTPPDDDEPILYSNEFSWGYTQESMAEKFAETYVSNKRLADRAYFDDDAGVFVLKTNEAWGGEVILSRRLVENVTMHIERAHALGYADHVFFPDMGHSHFFIPQEHWDTHYAATPVDQIADRNTKMFDDPELKVLYHTAAQLEMLDEEDRVLDDPWVQWRFHTRNVVGDNDWHGRLDLLREYESKANTSRDYPGHHYFGAGFNISANENGCFPYRMDGRTYWYDLSLSDLPYDTSDGGFF